LISTIKASKLLRQGYIGYWCYAMEVKEDKVRVENILIVCEFLMCFLRVTRIASSMGN